MPVDHLFSRREALTGGSEAHKKSVRKYLEAEGYGQTRDSLIEGGFEDMVFTHPDHNGVPTHVEVKAEALGVRTAAFADALVKTFRMWQRQNADTRFHFRFFVEEAKKPEEWDSLFDTSGANVPSWTAWYNQKRAEEEPRIEEDELADFVAFVKATRVTVGTSLYLEMAAAQKSNLSVHSLVRTAEKMLETVNQRKSPMPKKSMLVLNIARIAIPSSFYVGRLRESRVPEVNDLVKDRLVPPFFWRSGSRVLTFVPLDEANPLTDFLTDEPVAVQATHRLQVERPSLAAKMVNAHLVDMWAARGLLEDRDILYFSHEPAQLTRSEKGPNGLRQVAKSVFHQKPTKFAKKGDLNFVFHSAVSYGVRTYWGESYLQLSPRRLYTKDGTTPLRGDAAARADRAYFKPEYDQDNNQRLSNTRLWRHILFDFKSYSTKPEPWYDLFKIGEFEAKQVLWCPTPMDRQQQVLEV